MLMLVLMSMLMSHTSLHFFVLCFVSLMLMSLVKANILRKFLRKQQNEYICQYNTAEALESFNKLLGDILFCICL